MSSDFFADFARKQEELEGIFQSLPETVIVGAMGDLSPSGSLVSGQEMWRARLILRAWREHDGPVNKSRLDVTKVATESEVDNIQDSVSAESVVAFRGKLSLDNPFGDARAELISIIPNHQDAELEAFVAAHAKPVQFTDSQFGVLTLNRKSDRFEASAEWCGNPVSLMISSENAGTARALEVARALWDDMETWKQNVDAYAAAQLLPLKNKQWLNEGENEVTTEAFIDAMCLEWISVYEDGSFEFWHNDGGLFCGHSIQICGTLAKGLSEAGIHG